MWKDFIIRNNYFNGVIRLNDQIIFSFLPIFIKYFNQAPFPCDTRLYYAFHTYPMKMNIILWDTKAFRHRIAGEGFIHSIHTFILNEFRIYDEDFISS